MSTPAELESTLERRWIRASVLEVNIERRGSGEERRSFSDAIVRI